MPDSIRKLGEDRACDVCTQTFYAPRARPNARFCSMACKGIAARRTFTCETCGVATYGFQNVNKRWCSRACASAARKRGATEACSQCGERFYAKRRIGNAGTARFCGNACHNLWQGRNKTDHICKMCGKGYRWSPSRVASGKYNPTYCSLPCRDADPARRAMLIAMQVKQQLGRMTSAEAIGYVLLDALGVDYLRQEPFQGGKFVPDALIPSAMLVVQFDGDYWHDRKGASTEPRIQRRVRLDQSQDAYIHACGWGVIRLWESDLKADPDWCAEQIRQRLPLPA